MHIPVNQQQQRIHYSIAPLVAPPLPGYAELCGGERCIFETALQSFGVQAEPPKLQVGVAPFLQSDGTVQWQIPCWQMHAQQMPAQQTPMQQMSMHQTHMHMQQTHLQQVHVQQMQTQHVSIQHMPVPQHSAYAAQLQPAAACTPTKLPPSFKLCVHCHEPFDISRNHKMACVRHKHDKPVVEDKAVDWHGWDDRFRGPKDHPWVREQFPNAFVWLCCGRPSRAAGCMSDDHVPKGDEDFVVEAAVWAANAGNQVQNGG